jgi:hypothetical protein
MRVHHGVFLGALICSAASLSAQVRPPVTTPEPSPARRDSLLRGERREDPKVAPARHEGDGPFPRLVIRGVTLIDGSGGPPRGPVDVVIENNRIADIVAVGTPKLPIDSTRRPRRGDRDIDANGMYMMPGIVDLHVHQGTPQKAPESEYYNKLWLAHGITTVRGVPFASFQYSVSEKARSAKNEITAPRYYVYQRPGTGWGRGPVRTPDDARNWVRWISQNGADGLKVGAERPEIMAALLDEAKKQGLGSTAHLQQTGVAQMNADDATKLGLGTVTHFYGLFESMYENNDVQPWPVTLNYNDEQDRFGQVARQWTLVKPRGEKWNQLLKNFKERDVTLDPTMSIYNAGRDLSRKMTLPWHAKYTVPTLWDYYQPSRTNHGSYWYYWTSWDEIAWKNFYHVWMEFVVDYKNMGGRVSTGSDAGFIYSTPGFATIEEMEMLQEAGFHPLEVIRSATLTGAQTLAKPKGIEDPDFGVVRQGALADLAIVDANPLENLKVLYGTGWFKLNDATRRVDQVGGVRWTIKDGIVYDAKQLLADVAKMVEDQRRTRPNVTTTTP